METFIIQSEGKKTQAIKMFLKAIDVDFKIKREKVRENDAFLEKINKARENYKKGEYITIKDTSNIWESILSE